MSYDTIVLASASERRSQLLHQIGVRHVSRPADLDEQPRPHEAPLDYVQRLAREKALAAPVDRPVLAADTTVVLDGVIFGKPSNEQDCVAMLMALSGRCHEVMTAVALHDGAVLRADFNVTRVTFRALELAECRHYWATGEAAGKAGAYAIQGRAAVFISKLEGSFSCVMGLPLYETAVLLDAAGVRRWQSLA